MATYSFDFDNDTTGQLPSGIVHFNQAFNWTVTVEDYNGRRGLKFAANNSGNQGNFAAFDDIGVVDDTYAKEIVTHILLPSTEDLESAIPIACLNQGSSDVGGYALYLRPSATEFQIVELNSGGNSTAQVRGTVPYPFTLALDQVWRVRFRRLPTGHMRARIVNGETDTDELAVINSLLQAQSLPTVGSIDAAKDIPEAWHINSLADTDYTSGRFSVGALSRFAEPFYDYVGIATAGETAPTPSSGTQQPVIANISATVFEDGQTGIVITGTGFGPEEGTILISSSASNPGATPIAQQTVTAWSDNEITFTAVRSTLPFLSTRYLYIFTAGLAWNATGVAVEIIPKVHVQESIVNLSGVPVALDGEALLVWRSRPTAANPNPDQVITLGQIPDGEINVKIQRGSLQVGDPVWVALVSPDGNAASMKRVIPTYT